MLRWHITSRTTLRSGLYEYDAIGRVQDSAALRALDPAGGNAPRTAGRRAWSSSRRSAITSNSTR